MTRTSTFASAEERFVVLPCAGTSLVAGGSLAFAGMDSADLTQRQTIANPMVPAYVWKHSAELRLGAPS